MRFPSSRQMEMSRGHHWVSEILGSVLSKQEVISNASNAPANIEWNAYKINAEQGKTAPDTLDKA